MGIRLDEFINTNQNELTAIYIYTSDVAWDDWKPDYEYQDMRDIPDVLLRSTIDAWTIDVNFIVHVLM